MRGKPLCLCLLSLLIICQAGCSGQKVTPQEQQHLSGLARAYGKYMVSTRGNRPNDMEALKTFVKKMTAEELASANFEADKLDSMFISTRDGQEYVLHPVSGGGVPGMGGAVTQTVVLYEKEGKAGKRLVAYETTQVELVDEDKFKQLVPDAK